MPQGGFIRSHQSSFSVFRCTSHSLFGTISAAAVFAACPTMLSGTWPTGKGWRHIPSYLVDICLVGINVAAAMSVATVKFAQTTMFGPSTNSERTGEKNLSKKLELELELMPAAAKVMKSALPPGSDKIQQTRN